MIESLRGRLLAVAADHVVVSTGALALRVQVPAGVADDLGRLDLSAAEPAEVQLAAHLVVRPESWQIYGFRDAAQRDAFRILIGITGIGPRLALALLSHLTLAELVAAIQSNDPTRLVLVPGIGKRTAARILVELADKLQAPADPAAGISSASLSRAAADAVTALTMLGLAPAEASRRVRALTQAADGPSDTAGIVAAALKGRAAER